jgi:hypothetical protein
MRRLLITLVSIGACTNEPEPRPLPIQAARVAAVYFVPHGGRSDRLELRADGSFTRIAVHQEGSWSQTGRWSLRHMTKTSGYAYEIIDFLDVEPKCVLGAGTHSRPFPEADGDTPLCAPAGANAAFPCTDFIWPSLCFEGASNDEIYFRRQ